MEPESPASKAKRRARAFRRHGIELVLAAAFVGAVLLGDQIAQAEEAGFALKAVALGLPLIVLTGWWALYALHIMSLGEFERAIAMRSLAISCGVTVWITTAWGLAAMFAGVPALPLVMIAPLAAVIYGLVCVFYFFFYR